MMRKICVVADDPGNTVGSYVSDSIKSCGAECVSVYLHESPVAGWINKDAVYGVDKIPTECELIIFGVWAFKAIIDKQLGIGKGTKIVLTTRHYIENYDAINRICNDAKMTVYAMPDLFMYRGDLPTRPFYHPMLFGGTVEKNQIMTVCHSPSRWEKMFTKGTEVICKKVRKFPVKFELVLYKSWQESVAIKAKSHIFIDQIVRNDDGYIGGLGKSGMEAMKLGCLTITSGTPYESEYLPSPPMVWCNSGLELKEALNKYIYDTPARNKLALEQKEWADKYLSAKFVGENLLRE